MVTSRQIAMGVGAFVDREILPMLDGATRYGVSVAAVLGANWLERKLEKLRASDAAKDFGLVSGDGFDLDTLRSAMLSKFPESGIRIEAAQVNAVVNRLLGKLGTILPVEMEGGITFHRTDVETLYRYILGD